MGYRDVISIDELRRRFCYNPRGYLVRIVETHTRSFVGQRVFGNTDGKKYLLLKIGKKNIPFHVAVFAIVNGRWPRNLIDHKNGNGLDNKIGNLREATHSQNLFNTKLRSDNSSGHRGIFWDQSKEKWKVALIVNNKQLFFGRFKKLKEAVKAQRKAITKYHKEFSKRR